MRLALLAIAALPLLGGCISQVCDVPTATFTWTLENPNGVGLSCGQRGVSTVDVYIGLDGPISFYCTDYRGAIDVSGLATGPYQVTVEGIDSSGAIVDRDQFQVTVGDCGASRSAAVLREGLLNLDYHFGTTPATDVCHGADYGTAGGASYLWFALWDEVAHQYLSVIGTGTVPATWKTAYACGTSVQFSVPFGSYRLDGMQEVIDPLTGPTSIYETCTPARVVVDSSGVGGVTYLTPPLLSPTSPTAPACYLGAAP